MCLNWQYVGAPVSLPAEKPALLHSQSNCIHLLTKRVIGSSPVCFTRDHRAAAGASFGSVLMELKQCSGGPVTGVIHA